MFSRALKDLSFIKRWSIVRKLRDQSVAEHSWLVVAYTDELCVYLGVSAETHLSALRYATYHDIDEIFSGDFPGPAKRDMVTDRAGWDAALAGYVQRVFPDKVDALNPADPFVKKIVKVADWIEAAMESATEFQMGNRNVDVHLLHDTKMAVTSAGTLCSYLDKTNHDLVHKIRCAVRDATEGQSPGPVMASEMNDAVEQVLDSRRWTSRARAGR